MGSVDMDEAAARGHRRPSLIKVLSAVSHGMSTVPLPERMPNEGEFVAVRVLVRREQDKTRSSCRS